jgi:hypothetical protein
MRRLGLVRDHSIAVRLNRFIIGIHDCILELTGGDFALKHDVELNVVSPVSSSRCMDPPLQTIVQSARARGSRHRQSTGDSCARQFGARGQFDGDSRSTPEETGKVAPVPGRRVDHVRRQDVADDGGDIVCCPAECDRLYLKSTRRDLRYQ